MVWNLEDLGSYKIDYSRMGWTPPLRQFPVAIPYVDPIDYESVTEFRRLSFWTLRHCRL